MDSFDPKYLTGLVSAKYIEQATQASKARQNLSKTLLTQRRLPEEGWDDASIEAIMQRISLMDANNFVEGVGVGEREGRVYSDIVARRHFRLSHGMGRSGELVADQPKAAGSSLLCSLTNMLAIDALRTPLALKPKKEKNKDGKAAAGAPSNDNKQEQSSPSIASSSSSSPIAASPPQPIKSTWKCGKPQFGDLQCLVAPVATGMSLTLVMLALRLSSASSTPPTKRHIIWPRIDQKSCMKSMQAAGFEVSIVENIVDGDQLRTDVAAVEARILELGPENVFAVLSTTSCFAPRTPDRVVDLAKICLRYDIPHIINNAYGAQSWEIMHQISVACQMGRVDAFVQSCDKNYLVPVGGAVIATHNKKFLEQISTTYPGRASITPVVDLFITYLLMGSTGLKNLISDRAEVLAHFKSRVSEVAVRFGERVLDTPDNPLSFAMTLDRISEPTSLGANLFYRSVSGPRVVPRGVEKEMCGVKFRGFGAHTSEYPHSYLTMACAIGLTKEEVDEYMERLEKCYLEIVASEQKKSAEAAEKSM